MNPGRSYILRAFHGGKAVIVSTVAEVPGANSYPIVGQVIDEARRVTKILESPNAGEYWVAVTSCEVEKSYATPALPAKPVGARLPTSATG